MPIFSLDDATIELPADGRYWVAPTATVIGKVRLGRDASVWFGAVLRGDNELIDLGERTNIQDNCVLHTDMGYPMVLGAGVTVGHMAMLHGCRVGDNALVGIGATVLNGAEIGPNCIIGAHALIPEGKSIPANSLVVGMPGRVVRTLSEAELADLPRLADHYVQNYQRYTKGLRDVTEHGAVR